MFPLFYFCDVCRGKSWWKRDQNSCLCVSFFNVQHCRACALTSHMAQGMDMANWNPVILVFFCSLCGAAEFCLCAGCCPSGILHQVTSFPMKSLRCQLSSSFLLKRSWSLIPESHNWADCLRVVIHMAFSGLMSLTDSHYFWPLQCLAVDERCY